MKGHQDSGTPMTLMQLASMNVEMDLAAKQMINKKIVSPVQYCIPGELWCCYIAGQWLTEQVATPHHKHINWILIKEYWDKKVHYKEGHKSMINYKMTSWAIQGLPKGQQRWAAKMAVQFLPYRMNMKRWQMQTEDKCPQCHQLEEGKDHITQCQVKEATEQWKTSLQQLDDWLQNTTNGGRNQTRTYLGFTKMEQGTTQHTDRGTITSGTRTRCSQMGLNAGRVYFQEVARTAAETLESIQIPQIQQTLDY